MKLTALWVVPFQSDEKLGQDLEDTIKGGVKLEIVSIRECKEKNISWKIRNSRQDRLLRLRFGTS